MGDHAPDVLQPDGTFRSSVVSRGVYDIQTYVSKDGGLRIYRAPGIRAGGTGIVLRSVP